jgi:hypothetical protein
MEASFGIALRQRNFKGALLYKLQRKYATITENLPNNSTEHIKDTATNMYLLVVWEIGDHYHGHRVCLIECTDEFAWDEDKLWALHHQYIDQLYEDYNYHTIICLTNDNILIRVRNSIVFESEYKVSIIISEGTELHLASRPIQIDPKRLVLSIPMLIVLIYTVSLSIQPSFKLNIHNRCLNVSLVSPMYATGDGLECYRPSDYKVFADGAARSDFIINKSEDASYGVLIYRLQEKRLHESSETSENTSSVTHLLVVWRISESKKLYTYVALVEHTKAFTWNRDKLNKLYHSNHDRPRERTDITSDMVCG